MYLEKESVEILDSVAELTDKTRSEIVREVVDNIAKELKTKMGGVKSVQKDTDKVLQEMVGAASFKPKIRARDLDSIYEATK